MRHGNKINALGRKKAHREAMLANMACSLIEHKRINTTVTKAKELRKYVEPLITKSKMDSTHSRRVVFSYLKSKDAVSELFREVAPKVAERPGGYLRILKTGRRLGDSAEMCMVELVDFNELLLSAGKPAKAKRSRRGGKKKSTSPEGEATSTEAKAETAAEPKTETAAPAAEKEVKEEPKTEAKAETKEEAPKAEAKEEAPKAEEKKEEAPKAEAKEETPKAEDKKEDAPKTEAKEEAPKAEEKKEEPKEEKKADEAPKAEKDDKKDDSDDKDDKDKKKNE